MLKKCPPGKILRDGYKRKAYVRSDGVHVRAATVKPSCVPDKGKLGKTLPSQKVLPKPVKGSMGQYGYFDLKNKSTQARHKALTHAVKAEDYATIVRRINLIANYNKRSNPRVHKIIRSDMAWMKDNLYPLYSKTALREMGTISKKAGKRVSKKVGKRASKKAGKRVSKKAGKRVSKKAGKRVSKRASKRTTKTLVKAGKRKIGPRQRQLYHLPNSTKLFYRYRKRDGTIGRRYI